MRSAVGSDASSCRVASSAAASSTVHAAHFRQQQPAVERFGRHRRAGRAVRPIAGKPAVRCRGGRCCRNRSTRAHVLRRNVDAGALGAGQRHDLPTELAGVAACRRADIASRRSDVFCAARRKVDRLRDGRLQAAGRPSSPALRPARTWPSSGNTFGRRAWRRRTGCRRRPASGAENRGRGGRCPDSRRAGANGRRRGTPAGRAPRCPCRRSALPRRGSDRAPSAPGRRRIRRRPSGRRAIAPRRASAAPRQRPLRFDRCRPAARQAQAGPAHCEASTASSPAAPSAAARRSASVRLRRHVGAVATRRFDCRRFDLRLRRLRSAGFGASTPQRPLASAVFDASAADRFGFDAASAVDFGSTAAAAAARRFVSRLRDFACDSAAAALRFCGGGSSSGGASSIGGDSGRMRQPIAARRSHLRRCARESAAPSPPPSPSPSPATIRTVIATHASIRCTSSDSTAHLCSGRDWPQRVRSSTTSAMLSRATRTTAPDRPTGIAASRPISPIVREWLRT